MKENKSTVSFFKKIFYIYILAILAFSGLYMLPFSQEKPVDYIDALFLSTSALSVTGLSTINVEEKLSWIGESLLLLEMQLGGIGILVLVSYLFLLMGKKMSVTDLWMMKRDQNQSRVRTVGSLGLSILVLSVVLEVIGFALMYPTIAEQSDSTKQAVFTTVFHAVSSFTNGGFTLFTNGMMDFQHSLFFIMVTGLLIFLGGLGYPTLMEYFFNFRGKKTLFTQINVRFHTALLLLSAVLYLGIEWNNLFSEMDIQTKITNAFFLGFTSRSGGLNTVDTALLDGSTVAILLGLMFIGGASTSTAGGIRLTTFAVVVAKIKAVVTGNDYTVIFKKNIAEEVVNKSFLIFTMFILLFFASSVFISFFEPQSLTVIAFEAMSALTNTGLSQGITESLSIPSKLTLIALMVIGRVGIFSVIYLIFKLNKKQFKYMDEDLIVG